ncbi:MAG: 2-iminoacetate synthase ThiH [Opitutales bacterium]|nr:2-iminoacetate synthase ThiH [Opitutales bacterium]
MVETFADELDRWSWDKVNEIILNKTPADVEAALSRTNAMSMDDFMALVSPAASSSLERMATASRELTRRRFGNVVQMYVPLYLSNECTNVCDYCGFSSTNQIPRKTLNPDEILGEAEAIKKQGFDHVLLVSGEAHSIVGPSYFRNAMTSLRPYFSNVSMEVQPLEQEHYEEMIALGLHAVLVYQETYHREVYRLHHPKGRKCNFNYRLATPERLGRSGINKIGLGCLLGLAEWRTDLFFLALHLRFLEKRFWRTRYSVSFPRLRPFEGEGSFPIHEVSDRDLAQAICAFRLLDPELELSLSTRESPRFRDHAARFGITSMSAGSKTNPGGYANGHDALEQFVIDDSRDPAEIERMLNAAGYEAVWKDWNPAYDGRSILENQTSLLSC